MVTKINSGEMVGISRDEFFTLIPDRYQKNFKCPVVLAGAKFFIRHSGNFTMCLVQFKDANYIGVAKKAPQDFDSDVGLRIAATRAFRAVVGLDPKYGK